MKHKQKERKSKLILRGNILCGFGVVVLRHYHRSYVDLLSLVSRDDLIAKLVEENKVSFEAGEGRGVFPLFTK